MTKQKQHIINMIKTDEELGLYEEPKQETIKEAKFNSYKEYWNEYHTQLVKSNFLNGFENGAKWQQERLCDSEVIQRIRASKSDAEAIRIIRTI